MGAVFLGPRDRLLLNLRVVLLGLLPCGPSLPQLTVGILAIEHFRRKHRVHQPALFGHGSRLERADV